MSFCNNIDYTENPGVHWKYMYSCNFTYILYTIYPLIIHTTFIQKCFWIFREFFPINLQWWKWTSGESYLFIKKSSSKMCAWNKHDLNNCYKIHPSPPPKKKIKRGGGGLPVPIFCVIFKRNQWIAYLHSSLQHLIYGFN